MNWKTPAIITFLFLCLPAAVHADEDWNATPDKSWTIDFNKEMDGDREAFVQRAEEAVYIETSDDSRHPIRLSAPGHNRLKVTPRESYEVGDTYTLVVEDTLRDESGTPLTSPASRTFTVQPYGDHLGTFTADKELPSYAVNTTIEALHSLPYWKWTDKDQKYLKQEVAKQQLFQEMKTIQEELREVNSHYLSVNGFHFYTSAVHSKLDALERAMEARYNLLYFNQYDYPETSVSYNEEYAALAANDSNGGQFEADRKLFNALIDYPYDTSYTDNITVVSTPFIFEGINGFAKSSNNTIYLSALQETPVKTLYHELGHMFDYFFEPSREEYETIRNYSSFDDTYDNSYIESFAEDFKVVRYPYEGVLANLNDIGTPKDEEIEQLEKFFNDQEQATDPEAPSLSINGEPLFSDIQVARTGEITFTGENLFGSIQVETPGGKQDSVEFGETFTFTEEGVYNFRTPTGKILFLYDKDGVWPPKDEGTLQRVTMGQLTGDAYEWASALEFEAGVFSYEKGQSLLMINGGYYQPFRITDTTITSEALSMTLDQGRENYYIYVLPPSLQELPVVLKNNFLDIPDSTSESAVHFSIAYEDQTYTVGESIYLSGIAHNRVTPLSYRISDKEGNIIASDTLVDAGNSHYDRFEMYLDTSTFTSNEYTFAIHNGEGVLKSFPLSFDS